MKILIVALALAYPLFAHLGVILGDERLILAAVAAMALLFLLPHARRHPLRVGLILLLVAMGLGALARQKLGVLPLYAAPILLHLGLAWLFGHTLMAGRVPLLERLARHMRGQQPEQFNAELVAYTRLLTGLWTGLFQLLASANLVLALCAVPGGILLSMGVQPPFAVPQSLWSLFANLLNYVLVGALFVLEYAYRRRRFPTDHYRSFFDFLSQARSLGPALFRDMSRPTAQP